MAKKLKLMIYGMTSVETSGQITVTDDAGTVEVLLEPGDTFTLTDGSEVDIESEWIECKERSK